MKWKVRCLIGDKRRIRLFAYFPKDTDGYTVWLEYYYSYQEYTRDGWMEYKSEAII